MTGSEILFAVGIVLAFSKIATILIARSFCARPIPQWIRLYQEFALALVGARLIARHAWDLGLDAASVAIWVNLAGVAVLVLAMNARRVFTFGDRCPPRTG